MNEQELVLKLKELRQQEEVIFKEQRNLQEELKTLRIRNLLADKTLAKWAWKYEQEGRSGHTLLACIKLYPKELESILGWDHDYIKLTDQLILGWDDGEVYLNGPIEELYHFIKEQGVTVDFSKLNVPYIEALQEIERLKELMDMFGVEYKKEQLK